MKIHSMSISIPAAPNLPLCNAACPFCISRLTGKIQRWETGLLDWRERFRNACGFCKNNGVNTLLVTGKGEPMLNLSDTLDACITARDFFSIIEIQTNGSLCSRANLEKLVSCGLTTIAISVSHPDPVKNASLIKLDEVAFYQETARVAGELGLVVRISYNLSRAWEDSGRGVVDQVKEILARKAAAVNQYTFRIVDLPPVTQRPEYSAIAGWIEKHRLPPAELDKIHSHIKSEGVFLRQLNWGASIYDVNGYSVAIVECLQKPTGHDDDIRSVIFMPDGHVYTSWELTGSILF